MDSDQWKRLDKLLHEALERPPEERDAFLRQACAGDERLEREARSLLTQEQQAKSFLEMPSSRITVSSKSSAGAGWGLFTKPRISSWAAPWP